MKEWDKRYRALLLLPPIPLAPTRPLGDPSTAWQNEVWRIGHPSLWRRLRGDAPRGATQADYDAWRE